MVYGYVRVSTDKQTDENQRLEIREFCGREGIKINEWIHETISGTKAVSKRKLGKLIDCCTAGDLIICTELSRLGRSLMMIMTFLNHCMEHEIRVWTIKDGYRLGDDIQSKVLAFAFGLSAEIERQLISDRTKAGLKRARAEGKQIGRLPGQKPLNYKLTPKYDFIRWEIERGKSINGLAKRLDVTWITLRNFCKRTGLL